MPRSISTIDTPVITIPNDTVLYCVNRLCDEVLDGRFLPISHQPLQQAAQHLTAPALDTLAGAYSSASWTMKGASTLCWLRFHPRCIEILYTMRDVDDDTLCCAEPPATYQVRSRCAGHWFWLNNVVVDHHARFLGPEALALYACLARHAANTTQECWPTIPRMEQGTGMSRNRVRKALKRLAAYGLITLEEQAFARYGKVWRGYLITLLDPAPLAVSQRQRPGEQLPPPHAGTRRRRQGRAVTFQP